MGEKDIKEIKIKTEYITLGQLLKFTNIVSYGGEVKEFINNHKITLDNVLVNQRGKKIYPGNNITIDDKYFFKII